MGAAPAAAKPDVVLVGAGIMSATLGVLLKELSPGLVIELHESLERPALESSGAWNNAGTGHAGYCELNYTPERPDGSVDITKALAINGQFDLSRQLWAYLAAKGVLADPASFIHPVPHMCFVRGAADVAYLRERFATMNAHHCFAGMQYTEDRSLLADWAPLVMEGRGPEEPVAATRTAAGADVDFGALTRGLISHLESLPGFTARYSSRVTGVAREACGRWTLTARDPRGGGEVSTSARFVFLGAGGGALSLLQKSGIPEARGYAGFPVSGFWLRCSEPGLAGRHGAKVYGRGSLGAPPISVPHLDARVINGQRSLLFGPYAGFSTNFLKYGSLWDFFLSLRPDNIVPLLAVAKDNLGLIGYLVGQVLQSSRRRFAALREFYPLARPEDWRLMVAGQRVQIVKPDPARGGRLEFGTELVSAADRSLVALLGASPGASTAAHIAVSVIGRCFKDELACGGLAKLKEIIPSYGLSLAQDADLCRRVRARTAAVLGLLAP